MLLHSAVPDFVQLPQLIETDLKQLLTSNRRRYSSNNGEIRINDPCVVIGLMTFTAAPANLSRLEGVTIHVTGTDMCTPGKLRSMVRYLFQCEQSVSAANVPCPAVTTGLKPLVELPFPHRKLLYKRK